MLLIIILSSIPVLIWIMMSPLSLRFNDFTTITTSIGQLLGLVGMMLFSINLILSSKLKILDKYFKGLDKVYVNHQKIGAIAFSMILFHPIFLVIKYLAISTQTAALFFVPFISPSVTWGILSLLLMIILIIVTFYIKLKYHIWKMSHKFMIVAFVFTIIHVLLINSDTSRSHFLGFYIFIFAFTGLILSIRQSFFGKFLTKRINYKINKVSYLGGGITEIEMLPQGEKLLYKSGQFIFVNFIDKNIKNESHPFTISSSPQNENLKLSIKSFGDYTNSIQNLSNSSLVKIEGPYGNFNYRNNNKNQIWIAGGIGITPFLSMANDLDYDYKVDLYYCVKEGSEAVYINNFSDIASNNHNFKVNLWSSKDKGFINVDIIKNISGTLVGKEIFICGPKVFMESLKSQFVENGVDVNKIHYENFNF